MAQHYMVIRYYDDHHKKWMQPLVSRNERHPENMYWGGGPSHWHWPEKFEVLKDYGVIGVEDDFDPHIQSRKDFPPEPYKFSGAKRRNVYGYVSPDGKLYQCEREGHTDLAYDICVGLLDMEPPYRPEEEMFAKGWIRVSDTGFLSNGLSEAQPTEAQHRMIKKLARLNGQSKFADNLRESLELFR